MVGGQMNEKSVGVDAVEEYARNQKDKAGAGHSSNRPLYTPQLSALLSPATAEENHVT
jgi:hypothetical protein